MLNAVWRSAATHRYIVGLRGKQVNPVRVDTPEQGQEQAEQFSSQGWDAYFAPAAFLNNRQQSDCEGVESLWIDLDSGVGKPYNNPKQALSAFLTWANQYQFPQPSCIVSSGHGLHLHWLLDGLYPVGEWNRVAQHLKQALRIAEVWADPTRTADSASIMRVPGTNNYKDPDNPRPVQLLSDTGTRYTLQQLEQVLPRVGPQRAVGSAAPKGEWAVEPDYPLGNAGAIAKGCAQLRSMRDTRGALEEPLWRAGLSVLQRCEGADSLIHDWSKGDSRYDPAQTQQKAEATLGPATCAHFNETNPEGCKGCPWWGKITSPVQIQPAPPQRTEAEQKAEPWKLGQVGNFIFTDSGIYYKAPVEDGESVNEPERITAFPLWVSEAEERAREEMEQSAAFIVVQWRALDGRAKSNRMSQGCLSDKREFMGWMHENTIGVGVYNTQLLMTAISQYTRHLIQKQGAQQFYDRLGWTPEGFVLGKQMVTAKGIIPAKVRSSSRIVEVAPKGSLDKWCDAVRPLGHDPRFDWMAFSVLAGLGSPLLSLGQRQSAVLSLVGSSGVGKTLSAKLAMSPYGDPNVLAQGSSSTLNTVEAQLGACHHAPFMMDEITQFSEKRIGDLIFMAANGTGKGRLGRDANIKKSGSWCNAVFTTSNQPIMELAQSHIKEAQRNRVLELSYNGALSKADAQMVLPAVLHHHGNAALPFLQQAAQVRDKLPALFDQVETMLEQYGDLPTANRFGLWTLTSAWLAGWLADKAGLFTWDYDRIVKAALGEAHESASETQSDEERAQQMVREWLTAHSKQISDWKSEQSLGMPIDDPIARLMEGGDVALHNTRLKQAMNEEKIPARAFKRAFEGAIKGRKSIRLAPGTPPVWSVVMDADKLGFRLPSG